MSGLVTDIQRFSIHDGPGIRTTVFLKGCNLRCRWCHNPETIDAAPQLQFFPARCIGCGRCVEVCPRGAHELRDGRHVLDRSRCTVCGACAAECCAEALVVVGREMTAEEVLADVAADRAFYETSGGGATLSGGEPLCQRDFAVELARACRAAGIHTAVETAMACAWGRAEPLLAAVDMVLLDVKLADEAAHRRWTGASNRQVLANARRLGTLPLRVIVRTPVVPGVNDAPAAVAAIAAVAAELPNCDYYELLPYHRLGTGKYESLGMVCPMGDLQPPSEETMRTLAAAAAAAAGRLPVRAPGWEPKAKN